MYAWRPVLFSILHKTLARGDEYHRVRAPMQDVEVYDDIVYWTTPIGAGYCTSDGYISIAPAIFGHTEYLGELDLSTRGVDVYAIHPLDRDDDRVPFSEGELCWVLVWRELGTMTFVFKPVE